MKETKSKLNIKKVRIDGVMREQLTRLKRLTEDYSDVANSLIITYQTILTKALVEGGYNGYQFADPSQSFQMDVDGHVRLVSPIVTPAEVEEVKEDEVAK